MIAPVTCDCGYVGSVSLYDIGSGLEWTCPCCDFCYGYFGQALAPFSPFDLTAWQVAAFVNFPERP